MRESQRTENINERRSTLTGLIMTLAVHVAAFVLVSFTGLKYIYPPPEEQAMLIDFSVDMETVEQSRGVEPKAEEVDLSRPVELAQRSESPVVSDTPNLTP